ncbi:MAG: DUF2505 family protein [Proteobacteria bacterium]|nr:DUF2505 family protein [Pseudomonadota bacterium]
MKIHFRHAFDCEPEQLWALLANPDFERILEAKSNVRRVETSREVEGEIERSVHECTSLHELPSFATKVLGSRHLVYDQHSSLHRGRGELTWRIVPRVLTDRVDAGGVTRIFREDGRCIREVNGAVDVRVRLVGSKLEAILGRVVETSYANAAEAMRAYLLEHP